MLDSKFPGVKVWFLKISYYILPDFLDSKIDCQGPRTYFFNFLLEKILCNMLPAAAANLIAGDQKISQGLYK